jgi:hypothetical protein
MSLATLTIGNTPTYISGLSGVALSFENVNLTPEGFVLDQMISMQEELSDVGIDGRRWRQVNQQFEQFQMRTESNHASWSDGIWTYRNYKLSKGRIGSLSISLNGATYPWKNVKVLDCVPNLRRSSMVGNGIGSSVATIDAIWQMVLTKQSGNN